MVPLDKRFLAPALSRSESALPNPYEYELQHLQFGPEMCGPVKERIYGGKYVLCCVVLCHLKCFALSQCWKKREQRG